MYSCTHWLRPPANPHLPPAFGAHIRGRCWSAKIDDIAFLPHELNRGRIKTAELILKVGFWLPCPKGLLRRVQFVENLQVIGVIIDSSFSAVYVFYKSQNSQMCISCTHFEV